MTSWATPTCSCGVAASVQVVQKETPNKGRQYWKCMNPKQQGGCEFFEWCDPRPTDRKWPKKKQPATMFAPPTQMPTPWSVNHSKPVPMMTKKPPIVSLPIPVNCPGNTFSDRDVVLHLIRRDLDNSQQKYEQLLTGITQMREEMVQIKKMMQQILAFAGGSQDLSDGELTQE